MTEQERQIDLTPLLLAIAKRIEIGDAVSDGCEIGGDGNQGTFEIVQRWKLLTPEAIKAVERAFDRLNLGDERAERIRSKLVVFGDQPTSPP